MTINIREYSRENWEEAIRMTVHPHQLSYVPSVSESLATAYIKPWDEAFDPYLIYDGEQMIGAFYLSYTPDSRDNYWLGGFFIDKIYQGQGYGRKSLQAMGKFIAERYPACEILTLTVVGTNTAAVDLYRRFGFTSDGSVNRDGEVIYKKRIRA